MDHFSNEARSFKEANIIFKQLHKTHMVACVAFGS